MKCGKAGRGCVSATEAEGSTHWLLLHLAAVPSTSKHRRNGKEDAIQTFAPERLKHLDQSAINFGRGKRQLVPAGRFDAHYQITLPAELFATGDDHDGQSGF